MGEKSDTMLSPEGKVSIPFYSLVRENSPGLLTKSTNLCKENIFEMARIRLMDIGGSGASFVIFESTRAGTEHCKSLPPSGLLARRISVEGKP